MIQKRIARAAGCGLPTRSGTSCFKPSGLVLALAAVLAGSVILTQAMAQETPIPVDPSAPGPDSDGDGIRNQDDLDDDNDGILDRDEGSVDADGNGVHDSASTDTDGDGTPDVIDLDSDNDGILDNLEARTDLGAVRALDRVVNGAIDIHVAVGANGVADVIETSTDSGSRRYPLADTDSDGVPDFRDLDSDGDRIFDLVEAGGSDGDGDGRLDGFRDRDGKGVDDRVQASALPLFDTDGDGTVDFRDTDSDGDGIDDRTEGGGTGTPRDTDGDGAPDYRETDSDGDGTPDGASPGNGGGTDGATGGGTGSADGGTGSATGGSNDDPRPDRDGDGIVNQIDLDDDNDGLLDVDEGIVDADGDGVADSNSRDSDGDGTPDGNDLDSDNDGILDLHEGRLPAATVAVLDQVRNGAIDIARPVGANGIADAIETSPDSGQVAAGIIDSDGDRRPDYLDTDSDNDGIADLVEAGGTDADGDGRIDNFVDADSKGVDDRVQASALPLFDTDRDGTADYRDLDSDGDGISDAVEAGDGSAPADSDGDGAADYREQDSDDDGVSDSAEAGSNPDEPVDSDGDGTADFRDDGTVNGTPGDTMQAPGTDGDADGDGIANAQDDDADGDGILDSVEGGLDSDGDGVDNAYDRDSDNDGIGDAYEAFAGGASSGPLADSDGDGVYDYLDLDSDNDSVFDAYESDHLQTDASGRLQSAATVDDQGLAGGAIDSATDSDGDGVPDYRDLDSDNDGLIDLVEAGGVDSDDDGRIDSLNDANGDGADDGLQSTTTPWIDTDGDGIPDMRDLDSDNDSLTDLFEAHGASADGDSDGRLDVLVDANDDGLDDHVASAGTRMLDTDGDGLPDQTDLDSDNDGIFDLVEAGGTDADGDGRVDNSELGEDGFGPDGFGGRFADDGVVPDLDADSDGIPDFQDGAAFSGIGSGDSDGSGCSIAPGRSSVAGGADPSFGLLIGAAALVFALRRRKSATVSNLGRRMRRAPL